MSNNNQKVIIFGSTGAIGRHLIEKLSEQHPAWEITAVSRSTTFSKFSHLPNVTLVQGDAEDKDTMLSLCRDKVIVYSCIGFPRYERKYWAKHWPVTVDNLLAASSQFPNQKLVFCDNLYAYGPGEGVSPSSKIVKASIKSKPGIRAMLRSKFEARINKKPESITIVGGADFFGPLVTDKSFLGDTFTKKIIDGEQPICIGSKDVIHDFCYAPDFANALYVASISPEAYGKFWICPHAIKNKTMSEIANDIAKINSSKDVSVKVQAYPGWSIKVLSPFMSFMSEMVEMLPFWTKHYTVDDSDFCQTFRMSPTPYDTALTVYVNTYKTGQH